MNPVFLYCLTLSVQQIQWYIQYIPHNWLNRLDFSFGHSVFSLWWLIKRGEVRVFWYYLATSKFLALKSKAVFVRFLPFSKICSSCLLWCSMVITYSEIKRSRRWIMKYYLPKLRGRQTNFSRPFQPCFQIFRERGKVYPNKTYL